MGPEGRAGSSPRARRPCRRAGPAWRRFPHRIGRRTSAAHDPYRSSLERYITIIRRRSVERPKILAVWQQNLESHLIDFEVRPFSFEESVHGFVLAAPEEHDNRVPGDDHLEGASDQGDGVSPHAHVDAG